MALALAFILGAAAWSLPGRAAAAPATSNTATASANAATTTTQQVFLSGEALTQVNKLNSQAAGVQTEIDTLDAALEQRTEAYNELSVKLDRINVSLNDLRRQLAEAEAGHAARVEVFEERIRGVYKSGSRDSLLTMLLLADGLEDLYNRLVLISDLADQDTTMIEDLRESTARLDALTTGIEAQKRQQLSLRRQMEEARAQIEAKLAEREATLADIDAAIDTVVEEVRQRQAAEQERVRQALLGLLNGGQTYDGALPQNGDAVLDQLVQTAATYIGIPYVWAGDRPSTGFDCSGFAQYVYAQHGIQMPHYSGYQAQMGVPVDLADIQAGDLVAFGFPVHHVGIYIGDGRFLHAPRTGDVIKISILSERSDLAAIRRFPLQFRTGAPAVG